MKGKIEKETRPKTLDEIIIQERLNPEEVAFLKQWIYQSSGCCGESWIDWGSIWGWLDKRRKNAQRS